jgi:membrane protease subunit HflC
MKPLHIVSLLAAWLLGSSVYTLDAREVGVVTLFGKPIETVLEPGLKLRLPWPIHQVQRFDRRARQLDVAAAEVLTRDKKNLVVEAFVLWRISDPRRFMEAVGTDARAEAQISDLAVSRIAAGLGQRNFGELMSLDDSLVAMLPDTVRAEVDTLARERLGLEVLDLRLSKVGLPLQNEQSIYERMRAERSRIANAYRSEGEERAAGIRAEADRRAAEIMANAKRESAGIRARAEGAAAKVYAEAYETDPDLFLFLRKLEAADAMLDEDSVIVVSSEGPLFDALVGGR